MSPRLPAAVLWDLDGTLLDTEPYWIAEEYALVESFGGQWSHEHALALVGQALPATGQYIVERTPVALTPDQVVDRLLAGVGARMRQRLPWRPGARELLQDVRAAGIPTALVTMSYCRLTDLLEQLLPDRPFDVVVAGDEVRRGKPHPDPYATAAAALGVDPARSVAIEDSLTGARSAVAAGLATLVVPSVKPVPPVAGTVQVRSLEGLRAGGLAALLDGALRPA